jgi:PAS domain S-box-containing protein
MEISLRDSEEHYHTLFNAITDAVFVHPIQADGAVGKFLEVNNVACELLGYTRQELLNMTPLDIGDPDSGISLQELVQDVMAGESATFELRLITKDGRKIPVEIHGQSFTLGSQILNLSLVRDITERKRAEANLRESEQMLRLVLDTIPARVFWKDLNLHYLGCNRTFALDSGFSSPHDLIGKDDFVMGWANEAELYRADDHRVIETGQPKLAYEEPETMPDGRRIWVRTSKVPLRDGQGNVRGVLGTYEDITDRRQAEEEIRTLNAELEQRVAERTAQLEATNKELESFSYAVSHDLRAPLRGLEGFSQALLEDYADKLDEQGHHYLISISNAARRMNHLIEDLLKLSRLMQGELNRVPVNLSSIARDLAQELQQQEPERVVEFVIADRLTVHADERLIGIVMENLLNNAWKFTSKLPEATIEFGSYASPEGETVFFVRDNGAGFDMAYADRLFGAFQRLHTEKDFPGTGVGLATVKRIIHRHKGRVWVESEPDKGATFYFTIG